MVNEEEMEVKQQRVEKNEVASKNDIRHKNKIAGKFKLVATILKIIGYGGAILAALVIILRSEMEANGIILGIIVALIASLITWFSCLTWEAIAEIIQLLEDIKNK